MKTFIRAAEIWIPDADGYLLEFGSGLYDHAPAFGALSRSMCFGRGEGLPGRVWDEGSPVILHDLQGGFFQRAAAARSAELACAVAFPVFFGELMKAVVVLFCGDVGGQSGAIEIWRNEPGAGDALTLVDGVYGARDAAFETASRHLSLGRGAGLPGMAWERRASVFLDGLSGSSDFKRGEAASTTELKRGFALPCPTPGNDSGVLAFLSSPSTPIANRLESWVAGSASQSLMRAYGHDEAGGALSSGEFGATEVDAAIFETFAGGVPSIGNAGAAGRALALPVVRDGAVVETVALYL